MQKENIGELVRGILTLASYNNPKFCKEGHYTRMRELPKSAYGVEAVQLAYYTNSTTFGSQNWMPTLVLPAVVVANFYESCGQDLRDFFDQNFLFRVVSLPTNQDQQKEPNFFKTVEELLNSLDIDDKPEAKKETISPLDLDKLLNSLDSRLYYAKCMSPLLVHFGKNFVDNKFTELKKSVSELDLQNIFADLFTGGLKTQKEKSQEDHHQKFYQLTVIRSAEGVIILHLPMFAKNFLELEEDYLSRGDLVYKDVCSSSNVRDCLQNLFSFLSENFHLMPDLTCFLDDIMTGAEKGRYIKVHTHNRA